MDDLEVKALAIDWQEAVKTAIYDDKRRIDEVRHFRHIPAFRSRSLPSTLPLLPPPLLRVAISANFSLSPVSRIIIFLHEGRRPLCLRC